MAVRKALPATDVVEGVRIGLTTEGHDCSARRCVGRGPIYHDI